MKVNKPRILPAHARRVFKGVIFDVWQWEQKMYDGSTEVFERIWRPPTVEVLATVNDKILIEEQDQPGQERKITFPSGRADQHDDVLEEAKRELLEETGYTSRDWSLLLKHGGDGKVLHEVYYFMARNCTKVKEPQLDAGEKIRTRFITFDDFLRLTDESRFWVSPQFINLLLRARFDERKKNELKGLLFS